MARDLPSGIVAAIEFAGWSGGRVAALGGFRKKLHTPPDAVNAATQAFLGRVCAGELAARAEELFQRVRAGLGYRRKELALARAAPAALLSARDFAVELAYRLEETEPSLYRSTITLRGLRSAELARTEEFAAIFARTFTELSFQLRRGVEVEAVVDAVEALPAGSGFGVSYPSDCRECRIAVEGVEAEVRCTGMALEVVFPRAGSPRELMDGFAALRDAFELSPALAGLISAPA